MYDQNHLLRSSHFTPSHCWSPTALGQKKQNADHGRRRTLGTDRKNEEPLAKFFSLLLKELNRRRDSSLLRLRPAPALASSFNRRAFLQQCYFHKGLPGNRGHRGWRLKREPGPSLSSLLRTSSMILDTIQPAGTISLW